MTDNMAIWNALGKTDPAATKAFNRSGGFRGTAVKPMWVNQRLTEQFGACGIGWGIHEPSFQVVPADGEILVYCTVAVWHGSRENTIYGVGGDKVQTKRSSGVFNDDEAFKKAYTDAIGNAFKFIGVAADVHMGRFDDNKYVQQMEREFAAGVKDAPETPSQGRTPPAPLTGPIKTRAGLRTACGELVRDLKACGDDNMLSALLEGNKALIAQVQEEHPLFWNGDGADFLGLEKEIAAVQELVGADDSWKRNYLRAG